MIQGRRMKPTPILVVALLAAAPQIARAQEPPVPPPPVTSQPPVTAQPPVSTPPAAAPAAESAPARVELSEDDILRRRNAIFLMEGLLVNSVKLAASRTQSEIENAQPDLKVTLFSAIPPEARGNYLEDYGVFFQVIIPTYQPSVVSILNMLENTPRARAEQAVASRSGVPLNPDAVYVETVRQFLTNAMLDHSKALDLRPNEWLTVAARGADGAAGPVSEPSVMILRVKGSDLIDFLAGRLTRDQVGRRVEVRGFSGRR